MTPEEQARQKAMNEMEITSETIDMKEPELSEEDQQVIKEAQEEVAQLDPFEVYKQNCELRKKQVAALQQILRKFAGGNKVGRKEHQQFAAAVHVLSNNENVLLDTLYYSIFQIGMMNEQLVRTTQETKTTLFTLGTEIKTIIAALDKEGIISQEMMKEIHDKEILPKILKDMTGKEDVSTEEEKMREEDLSQKEAK